MEANVYFFAALVSTGIFLLQFILSIFSAVWTPT